MRSLGSQIDALLSVFFGQMHSQRQISFPLSFQSEFLTPNGLAFSLDLHIAVSLFRQMHL
jgi:hypothetical protein